MQDVAGWAIVISFVFGLSSMVFASWLASQRAEKVRVDALETRVSTLEERSKHTPTTKELATIGELAAEIRHMRAALDGVRQDQRVGREELRADIGRINDRFDNYERAVLREAGGS